MAVPNLRLDVSEGINDIGRLRDSTDTIDGLNLQINQVYEAIKESNPEAAEQLLNISNSLSYVSTAQREGIDEVISKSNEALLAAGQLEGGLSEVSSRALTLLWKILMLLLMEQIV